MSGKQGIGEFEQLVLIVVLRLGERAYAPEIARELEENADRSVTRGALYSTLNRLSSKGLLTWTPEDPGEDRGGHIRRLFALTEEGLEGLRSRRATLMTLWTGIEGVLDGRSG